MPTCDYEETGIGKLRVHWGVWEDERIPTPFGRETIDAFEDVDIEPKSLTFQDPLYIDERKTLNVYKHKEAPGYLAVFGEITPGVYAIGYQIEE